METKTINAIKGSIRKWDLIAQGLGVDRAASNCPLCICFGKAAECSECPVKLKTGVIGCENTPYMRWFYNFWTYGKTIPEIIGHHYANDNIEAMDNVFEACEEEMEFLISLLPPEEQRKYNNF